MPRSTFFNLPEDKRARVVEALKAEFAARPYARASVDRVIGAAGVSKGSFYQYFDNKEDAYAHLVRELVSASVELAGAATRWDGPCSRAPWPTTLRRCSSPTSLSPAASTGGRSPPSLPGRRPVSCVRTLMPRPPLG